MSLSIPRRELARLHAHAIEGYPHEVVGILAGDRATNVVRQIEPLVNERADSPRNRYVVSGLMLGRAEQRLNEAGLEVVGYYHSHPDHPSKYSDFDRDHALPNMSYPIVSVVGGKVADLLSWRIREDRTAMDAEEVSILEDPLVTIHIPTPLRPYTANQAKVQVEGGTVGAALAALLAAHPGLGKHLRDDQGRLRSFVNVYVGDEDIRHLKNEETEVAANAEITIVPSIAGGR